MNTKTYTYTAIVVTTEFRLRHIPYAEVEYVTGDAREPNEETIRIVVSEEHHDALVWLLSGHNSVIAFGEGEPEEN